MGRDTSVADETILCAGATRGVTSLAVLLLVAISCVAWVTKTATGCGAVRVKHQVARIIKVWPALKA